MRSDVEASARFSLLKLISTRAAFARPGPGATPFPDVNARIRPSDSLVPIDCGYGLPLPSVYLGADASSLRSHLRGVGRPCAHPRAHGASESGHRVSVAPEITEEKRGPPRLL